MLYLITLNDKLISTVVISTVIPDIDWFYCHPKFLHLYDMIYVDLLSCFIELCQMINSSPSLSSLHSYLVLTTFFVPLNFVISVIRLGFFSYVMSMRLYWCQNLTWVRLSTLRQTSSILHMSWYFTTFQERIWEHSQTLGGANSIFSKINISSNHYCH